MSTIIDFQKVLDRVEEVKPLLSEDFASEFNLKSEEFLKELQDSKYIKVPLVGVFSAGKSSLLNVFTQKPGMLPVDTEPETAVAYELYYAPTECVDLYRNGEKIDEKPLADIKQLGTKPGDIAKVYCSSEPIKKLQERGIILVDMPGIGSGIERHDAAIFNYIHSGTAFILVVDVEHGSLRSSTLAFMEELSQYNMHPAVLVSKIDKKPEKDVKEIVEYIQYQMGKLGDTNPYISTVCSVNNDLTGLDRYFDALNPEALLKEKLGRKLKFLVNAVIEQLKVRVELKNKDVANVDEKLKQIEEEIANVKAELPGDISQADSPEKSTRDILDNVEAALTARALDIAQMIIDREDQEAIKSFIVSIVRSEIITSMKDESEQYSAALGSVVQDSVKKLAAIEVDVNFMNDFNDLIQEVTPYIEALLTAGGIWGRLAQVLLPMLPEVLNWLFGKSDLEVLEEVRVKVMTKCVGQVTVGLKPTVYKMVVENQKRIHEKVQAELLSKIESVKEGLKEKLADANKSKEMVASEVEQLNAAIMKLESALDNI